jgi:hypothetical protein
VSRYPDSKNRLRDALQRSMDQRSASETALAWLTGFFWHEFDRGGVWKSILNGPPDAIDGFFSELEIEGYYLDQLFDQPEDVDALLKLARNLKGELQTQILDVIAEIPSEKALTALCAHNYQPSDWKAVHVLRSFVELRKWKKTLNKLLKATLQNCPKNDGSSEALGLIARYYAGMVDLDTVLTAFPKKDVTGFQIRKHEMSRFLERLKDDASPTQKRRLVKLIGSIDHDENKDD